MSGIKLHPEPRKVVKREPGPEVPLTFTLRKNNRIDIPAVATRAAGLEPSDFIEIRIISIDGERIEPAPHPFVGQIQRTNIFTTVPRAIMRLHGLKTGSVVDCYIRRM